MCYSVVFFDDIEGINRNIYQLKIEILQIYSHNNVVGGGVGGVKRTQLLNSFVNANQ